MLQNLLGVRLPGYVPPNGELEALMLRLIGEAGLPPPVRERRIEGAGFIDFLWPELRVAVETDGFVWHSSRHDWQRDRHKRNHLTLEGYTVVQITWDDLTQRPADVMASLSSLLRKSPQD